MASPVMRSIVLALLVLAACRRDPPAPSPAPSASAATTQTIAIDPGLVDGHRIALVTTEARSAVGQQAIPGTVEAGESGAADLTSLASGRVATLLAKVGDPVKKGQALATIESPEAGRAQADLLRARGRAVLTARALARQLELDEQAATSKAAVDQARAEDQAARADLAAARAVLASYGAPDPGEGAASSTITLRAPIAGVVVERLAVLGGPVAANAVLFRLVASDHVVVIARLPETSPLHPAIGDVVTVASRHGAGDLVPACSATVERVVPWVDDARTRAVRIAPAADCALVPGSFVEVRLRDGADGDAGRAIWVTTAALVEIHGVTSVFVAGTNLGSFTLRPVRTGATSGDDTEILSGLAAGERYAAGGALLLKGELLRQELQ